MAIVPPETPRVSSAWTFQYYPSAIDAGHMVKPKRRFWPITSGECLLHWNKILSIGWLAVLGQEPSRSTPVA
jgi:hypothetical protein